MRLVLFFLCLILLGCDRDISVDTAERLKALEGYSPTPYKVKDTELHYTIGYGHYGSDVTSDMYLSEEEAYELLIEDVVIRLKRIRIAIPDFDNLSRELQIELLQSWYRGGLSGSPITIKLINEKRFEEASVEFLRNREYQTTHLKGVKVRMESVAQALRQEAG